jgi:hypothetical protein
MTTAKENRSPGHASIIFNRMMYAGFVLLAFYFLVRGELTDAMTNLGISLIFDPFDQTVSWKNRPLYQRVWLLVHVSIVLTVVGIIVF